MFFTAKKRGKNPTIDITCGKLFGERVHNNWSDVGVCTQGEGWVRFRWVWGSRLAHWLGWWWWKPMRVPFLDVQQTIRLTCGGSGRTSLLSRWHQVHGEFVFEVTPEVEHGVIQHWQFRLWKKFKRNYFTMWKWWPTPSTNLCFAVINTCA